MTTLPKMTTSFEDNKALLGGWLEDRNARSAEILHCRINGKNKEGKNIKIDRKRESIPPHYLLFLSTMDLILNEDQETAFKLLPQHTKFLENFLGKRYTKKIMNGRKSDPFTKKILSMGEDGLNIKIIWNPN